MLNGGVFLAYGGLIQDALNKWEDIGVFSYVLPFLLIFALLYGILVRTKIFKENNSVNGIIAFAVALMALQFNMVSLFFSELFPRFSIGLIVVLVAMILLGMFSPEKWMGPLFFAIGAIILILVLTSTAGSLGWSSASWWADNWPDLALILTIIIVIGIVVGGGGGEPGQSMFQKIFGKVEA